METIAGFLSGVMGSMGARGNLSRDCVLMIFGGLELFRNFGTLLIWCLS